MGIHFENYLKNIEETSPGITPSLKNTVDTLIPKYIKTFSFRDHITGLLLGNVQSGKTSQVFGLISAAADEGFQIFIFLTTDNVYLHEQTLRRALGALDTFVICGEDDELRFIESKVRKPLMIVIKRIPEFFSAGRIIWHLQSFVKEDRCLSLMMRRCRKFKY